MNGSEKTPLARGQKRMLELAVIAEAERVKLESAILAEIGRPASTLDKIAAETLSASVVRARRLRALGKSDSEERKTILQAVRATGLRSAAPTAPAPPTIAELLAQRGYSPPSPLPSIDTDGGDE
jgi:hypothetical protein